MNSPDQWLAALLQEREPQRVLQLGPAEPPALAAYREANKPEVLSRSTVQALGEQPLSTRVDLCIVQPGFFEDDPAQAINAIAGIRNQYCHNVFLFVPRDELTAPQAGVTQNELFGLGMRKLSSFEHESHCLDCYGYELLRYNKKRSWNNAKFWANPENFGKYWW